jgi:succinyl-CoA synthetase beta subunit
MDLSEHQAKELLAQYGVPVPPGALARTAEEAEAQARALGCERFAVKAQILAGGRGEAGGVAFAATPSGVRDAAEGLLGRRLVTAQTGPEGETVSRVWVEAALRPARELYLAFLIDERRGAPALLGAAEGGVAFERRARGAPDALEALPLPLDGAPPAEALAAFLAKLDLRDAAAEAAAALCRALVRAAFETDALLVELNPVAVAADGAAVAVDAKMTLDDNALHRHPEFEAMAREAHRDPFERIARESDVNFHRLDGDVGVVTNGAGLALATNDILCDAGGRPANFMDIRTTATSFQIARGVGALLDDDRVKALLVNVHGGGMTVCDTVAEALSFAYARAKRRPPLVFRAAGQNADWALRMMKDRRLPFEPAASIREAANRAVALAGGRRRV